MNHRSFSSLTTMALLCFGVSTSALAQQGPLGTAKEARAMLDKAVAAVKADQAVALAMFNKGEGGFRDRDLYPFCFRVNDGKGVATPAAVPAGTDLRTLKDPSGKAFGLELYAAAQKPEGQVTEISDYMFPKPGTTAPAVPKVSFVTRVGDLACGVGYYK
jgi:signal transduction histidine kinase